MRITSRSPAWLALFAVALAAIGGPAAACLPPPPDYVPPPPLSKEERVRRIVAAFPNIVSGVVVRGSRWDGSARFLIQRVYKGRLKRGTTLKMQNSWGLDPPMCFGLMQPPPVSKGERGVVAFQDDRPELNFIAANELELAFSLGLLRRAGR